MKRLRLVRLLGLGLLIVPLLLWVLLCGCEKVEGEGGGVVSPTEGEPYIIESVTCMNVDDQSRPVWITDTFFVGDFVYLWIRWGNVSGTHTVTVDWFDPGGDLQSSSEEEFTAQGNQAISWFYLDTTSSAPEGDWWAEVFLDGEFVRSHIFVLVSS